MAKLTDQQRDALPDSAFGLPEERKYPMPDEAHARNAKARAAQQEKHGTITPGQKRRVDRKSDHIRED